MRVVTQPVTASNARTKIVGIRVCIQTLNNFAEDVRAIRAATTLAQEGLYVSVLDVAPEGILAEDTKSGVHVHHLPVSRAFATTRFKRWVLLRALGLFLCSVWCLLRTRADVYHALDMPALPACYIAALLRRKPLIFEAYELPLATCPPSELSIGRRWFQMLLAPVLHHIIKHCAGVIAVSPPIVEEMRQRYRQPNVALVRNIPYYTRVERTDRLQQYLHLAPYVRIALYQGNIQADRRLDLLVQAAAHLDNNTVIVLMGKAMDKTLHVLEEMISRNNLAERVKIIPPVPYEQLLSWTASADLGLLLLSPDYAANIRMFLPNKLFEYMMSGLPILSSPLEAVADILNRYKVGRIVESLTPEEIARSITLLLADNEACTQMRQNALLATEQELNWEQESQKLIELYLQVL